jgi:hypothetical protein
MSNTYKHKVNGKFNNELLQDIDNDIPLNVKKMWDRHNFEVGSFRNLRNTIKEKEANNDLQTILNNFY